MIKYLKSKDYSVCDSISDVLSVIMLILLILFVILCQFTIALLFGFLLAAGSKKR